MGAEAFEAYAKGKDVHEAFKAAVEEAQYDYGHAGYTGTIAEKDSFTVILRTPVTREAAQSIVRERQDDNEKWGPAFAIAIKDEEEHRHVAGWLFFGWASS